MSYQLQIDKLLSPLRIGVEVPTTVPSEGGGSSFQNMIFAEICKRSSKKESHDTNIDYWFVSPRGSLELPREVDKRKVLNFSPSKLTQYYSRIQSLSRRIRSFGTLSYRQETYTSKLRADYLSSCLHLLWSLGPSISCDNLPYITTIWDLQYRLQPFFPEFIRSDRWIKRDLHFKMLCRKAFLCMTGTRQGSFEISSFFNVLSSRILVNPFPCPPPLTLNAETKERVQKKFALSYRQYILYPAQFWPHKNHLVALAALKRLKENGSCLKMVLTGSDKGSLEEVLSWANNIGLSSSVIQTGFVTHPELAALYDDALCLIFPSFFGPDNLPPLEAMSYELPALVADVPGAREQYGAAAKYFDPSDSHRLAELITSLQRDSNLRTSLIREGNKLVSRLTPAAYVDRVEQFIKDSDMLLRSASLHS